MKTIVTILAASLFLTSCFSKGNVARVSTSSEYHKGTPLKVLILPLSTEGNPDLATNASYSDALATTLMDLGMRPIDGEVARKEALELGTTLDSAVRTQQAEELAQALEADAILYGTVQYSYVPPASGSKGPSLQTTTNNKGKQEINIDGGSSYSVGGYFQENSLSVRIVDATTSETLISGYIDRKDITGYFNSSDRYMPIDEMVLALKGRLAQN